MNIVLSIVKSSLISTVLPYNTNQHKVERQRERLLILKRVFSQLAPNSNTKGRDTVFKLKRNTSRKIKFPKENKKEAIVERELINHYSDERAEICKEQYYHPWQEVCNFCLALEYFGMRFSPPHGSSSTIIVMKEQKFVSDQYSKAHNSESGPGMKTCDCITTDVSSKMLYHGAA